MKIFKTIVIVALLFGLPAGSWYFLQSGLDWRKVKAKELAPKSAVTEIVNQRPEYKEKLTGRTTLLKLDQKHTNLDEKLIDQFKDAFTCLLYTSPSPRDATLSRMPSSA